MELDKDVQSISVLETLDTIFHNASSLVGSQFT